MPGTTSTALPSFSHDQQHETDAAKRKGGIFQLKMMEVVVITGANKTSKAPVKSLQLTNQHPAFYRPCCQSTNSVIASRGKTVANISIFCNRTKTLICTACTRAHTHTFRFEYFGSFNLSVITRHANSSKCLPTETFHSCEAEFFAD